jgi:hypothetical protein
VGFNEPVINPGMREGYVWNKDGMTNGRGKYK